MKCIAWHEIESIETTPKGRGHYMLKVNAQPNAVIHSGAVAGMCGMGERHEIDMGDLSRSDAENEADDLMRKVRQARQEQQQLRA